MDSPSTITLDKTISSSDTHVSNDNLITDQGLSSESSKPDWTNFTLDQKMDLLLDLSFKNSFEIRKVSEDLSKHTDDIKSIITNLDKNSADIKSLSANLNTLNSSLAKVTENQKSSDEKVCQLVEICNVHSSAIDLIKSTVESAGSVNNISAGPSNITSSQLLLSGVPENVTSNLSSAEIIHQVFNKLSISKLENDILSVRELKNRRSSTSHGSKHSFILNLKSAQVRDHIVDVKRRVKKLQIRDTFPTVVNAPEGQIYLNEFLHPDVYKLLKLTKVKARELKFKYVWAYKGVVCLKENDDSAKIEIRSQNDLNKLN
ncbi:hypothetical protein KQX54_002833 [Cotesia glomerata]|uniref:FP protein C-terminal domain-containing protein n=1 Tax=Cotesia glomerata TaxID=32391 RepID=A0AAV7J2T3_COTGL|nr:hypothetical protein KQX54_002833 [Cotesia glomerata]